ncbi:MAG: sugar phosphate isomerase/epimerase family protein [Elusimicrobiota bacterium]
MNKVGLCTIAFKDKNVDEVIKIAADCGAECVELWSRPPHVAYPVSDDIVNKVKPLCDTNNIEIVVLGSYLNGLKIVNNNSIDVSIENEIRVAIMFNAKIIRLWAGIHNFVDSSEQEIDTVIKFLQRSCDKAAIEGITIVIERHNNTITNGWHDVPLKLLERVGRKNCKLNYQPPYPFTEEDYKTKMGQDMKLLLPVSGHCHLQNYKIANGQHVSAPLGSGVIDYSGLGKFVRESGYTGAFMLEFMPKSGYETSDPRVIIKAELDYIKKIIR